MAGAKRSTRRVEVVERDDDEESSEPEDDVLEEQEEEEAVAAAAAPMKKLKIALTAGKGKKDVCKACGRSDHRAGFVGSVYVDCPNRACFLCKKVGHTTMTCPDRPTEAGGGRKAAPSGAADGALRSATEAGRAGNSASSLLRQRECIGRRAAHPPSPPPPSYQVDAAVLKLHTRRCCALEFPPFSNSVVVSGDKKGAVAVWNFDQVHERTVYTNIHKVLLNTIRFAPWLGNAMTTVTAASDGFVKVLDLETGEATQLVNLNAHRVFPPPGSNPPPGWWDDWISAYGMDVSAALGVVVAGDTAGRVHMLDPRLGEGASGGRGATVASLQAHKSDSKVNSVSCHPLDQNIILTAGNDHTCRMFDLRKLSGSDGSAANACASAPAAAAEADADPGAKKKRVMKPRFAAHESQLVEMPHGRVVNSAYFSPHTGRKIMTTCQDNRVRVWDCATRAALAPDREIVHSHDFNRYLTPFKGEWDHKDLNENIFVIGRYISEDFGGLALHPVDIMDAGSGRLLRQLVDTNLTTICPVNKMHPRRDLIVTGSSRSLYLWAPEVDEVDERDGNASAAAGGSGGDGAYGGGASSSQAANAAALGALIKRQSALFRTFDADPDGGGKKAAAKKKGGGAGGKKGGKQASDSD